MHRHDVQWTQSIVVELARGTEVTLDDENRDFAFVSLDGIERWLESHDTCQLATVERRVEGGGGGDGGTDAPPSRARTRTFERGTLGDL